MFSSLSLPSSFLFLFLFLSFPLSLSFFFSSSTGTSLLSFGLFSFIRSSTHLYVVTKILLSLSPSFFHFLLSLSLIKSLSLKNSSCLVYSLLNLPVLDTNSNLLPTEELFELESSCTDHGCIKLVFFTFLQLETSYFFSFLSLSNSLSLPFSRLQLNS